jgi:CrcB protein
MRVFTDLVLVGLGGAFGAMLRYGVSIVTRVWLEGHAAWGTLFVNMLGCFAIGVLFTLFDGRNVDRRYALLILVGIVGSFTTFSTYALEGAEMLTLGQVKTGIAYVVASNSVGLILVFLGVVAGRRILG